MNNKLPRLILVGAGTVAVAVLSAFSSKNSRPSPSGASLDAMGYEFAGPVRTSTPPATAVRG